MTYDQAVEAAKIGLHVARPGLLEVFLGWDPVRVRLFTVDKRYHKTIFTPAKSDREATDWYVLSPDAGPR